MNRFLIMASMLLILSCKRSNKTEFKLNGVIRNAEGSVFILKHDGKVYDQAIVKNDTFSLKGLLPNLELTGVFYEVMFPKGTKYGGKIEFGGVGSIYFL